MTYDELKTEINTIDMAMNKIFLGLDPTSADRVKAVYAPLLDVLEDEEYMAGMGEQMDREFA